MPSSTPTSRTWGGTWTTWTTSRRSASSKPSSRTCARRVWPSRCPRIRCATPDSSRCSRGPTTWARAPTPPRRRWPPMPPSASCAFTKLIVHDLEKMAAFYRAAYGLHPVHRLRGESIGGEEIDEIMLSADPQAAYGNLVLLKYLGRGPSPKGELILGFTTDDLAGLLDRVRAAGGAVHAPIREMPELALRVAFATDPEGHLAELVQMLA